MKRTVARLCAAVLLLASSVPAVHADEAVFESSIVGIPVANQVLRGVPGGGRPWVVDKGEARLDADGRLRVKVEGLLLVDAGALTGTTGPVNAVVASLFCRNTLAATTGAAPLTPAGDAEIEQVIAAPAVCDNPDVLVRISTNGVVSRWIAATSLT